MLPPRPARARPARAQIIAAARSVAINTCHDCIFYLGTNTRPAVLGDNRFLQLAPYNAGYERLAEHMTLAGVRPAPNLWDWPISLQPDHRRHHHEPPLHEAPLGTPGSPAPLGASPQQRAQQAAAAAQLAGAQQQGPSPMVLGGGTPGPGPSPMVLSGGEPAGGTPPPPAAAGAGMEGEEGGGAGEAAVASPVLGTPASVTLLPPGKLLPFLIPFVGGGGPMCGGPARVSINIRWVGGRVEGWSGPGQAAWGLSVQNGLPELGASLLCCGLHSEFIGTASEGPCSPCSAQGLGGQPGRAHGPAGGQRHLPQQPLWATARVCAGE